MSIPVESSFESVPVGGLTGATAASRYVGGTTSGAPASGTFAVGDYVIDQTGAVWVCTVAGTSGTWALVHSPTPPVNASALVTAYNTWR